MAWKNLPTNYKNASWTGLKKYRQIANGDGTISLNDVTQYINKQDSFFGANDANQMNNAMNLIMKKVEDISRVDHDTLNVTVKASAFKPQTSGTPTEYKYMANIQLADVKETSVCELYTSQASIDLGILSGECESYNGGIKIFASEVPSQDIVFNRIVVRDETVSDIDWTQPIVLENDCTIIKNKEQGKEITLKDSSENKIKGFEIVGKSSQVQTTGKNLFDIYDTVQSPSTNVQYKAYKLEPNTNYTLSTDYYGATNTLDCDIFILTGNVTTGASSSTNGVRVKKSVTVQSDSNGYITIGYRKYVSTMSIDEWKSYKTQLEKGSSKTDYEPYSGGVASPSPNYPQEIKSVDNPKVSVSGKNLIDFSKITERSSYGTTWVKNSDGTITNTGTPTGVHWFNADDSLNLVLEKGTYTLSDGLTLQENTNDKANSYFSGTFTLSKTTRIANGNYSKEYLSTHTILKPQLERGTKATSYEPYKQPQSITIPQTLRGLKVTSGGNYTDETGQQWICDKLIVNEDGTGKIERNVGVTHFTSNTQWVKNSSGQYYTPLDSGKYKGNTVNVLCTNLKYNSTSQGFFINSGKDIRVNLLTSEDTIEKIAQVMNGNSIIGELATPTTETLSASQVNDILSLQTYKPTTVISNDKDTEMSVTYVADTKNYIDNKFEALQNALVALGGTL